MDGPHLLARRIWPALLLPAMLAVLLQASTARAGQTRENLAKVDSHLLDLLAADARGVDLAKYASDRDLSLKQGKMVLVDVYFNGPRAKAQTLLRNQGMDVVATVDRAPFRIIEGWLPLSAVRRISGSPRVKLIVAVLGGGTNTDSVQPRG